MGALILLLLATTRQIRKDQRHAQLVQVDDRTSQRSSTAGLSTSGAGDDPEQDGLTPFAEGRSNADRFVITPEAVVTNPMILPVNPDPSAAVARQTKIEDFRELLAKESERRKSLRRQLDSANSELKSHSLEKDDYSAEAVELSALRTQKAKATEELNRKTQNLVQLQSALETSSKKTELVAAILSSRESALISLRQIAEQAEQQTPAAGTDQTVVEFTNNTGTRRSPILIDVTENGYEFQPAGIKVTAADMQGFPGSDNPLISGILGLHEWRNGDSLSVKPYVLLLVRPDGSLPFYSAQRFLKEAGIHFGYELLEPDTRISAGPLDTDERDALREVVLAALTRRQNLYGGLMSRIQVRPEPLTKSKSRQARVLPDGRVLFGDEIDDERDGRFYAGGEAPPARLPYPATPSRERVDPNESPGSQDALAKHGRATDEWASAFAGNDSDPVDAQSHLPYAGDQENLDVAIVPRATFGDRHGAASGTAEFEVADRRESAARQSRLKQLLLSGVGKISDGASGAPPKGSLASNDVQQFNAIDPSARSDWSTSEYAHSDSATRTAGPAGDPASSNIAHMNSGAVGGSTPESRSEVLERFGNPVTETGRSGTPQQALDFRAKPDPFLRAMLNDSRAKAPGGLISRVPVTVFVDATALTIGPAETINTAGWDIDQVLAATLQGLSQEMKFAPSISDGYSLPMVRFVVSPGGSLTQLQLAGRLNQAGIPSTAVTAGRSHSQARVLFEGQLDARKNDSQPEPEMEDRREPAEPVPPTGILRPPRRDRRLAL